jgi:heavy metal sensor kinase
MASIRSRIRYSSLLLIVVLLAIFSVLVYQGIANLLHDYVDKRLLALAENWAGLVEERTGTILEFIQKRGPPATPPLPEEERRELREVILSIRVLTLDGQVVWKGEAAVDRPPISSELLEQLRQGETVYDTISVANSSPVRRVSVPIPRQSQPRFVLEAETTLRFVENTLRGLMLVLVVFAALILALAWLGTGWLARKSLMPIEVLSTTTEQISASSMAKRLILDGSYDELRRLAGTFNAMMDRLQRVFEGQRRFVADAAHEIQTPLTVIKGNLELALQQDRSALEYREALISNLEEVDRLTALSRSLLTLAQFAGDQPPVRLSPLALLPVLQDVISDFSILAKDRDIELLLQARPVPLVWGDTDRLKQLFINLIDNALRYTPNAGSITVGLEGAGDRVFITVRDTGPGIGSEHLPHLFERFYRADSARSRDLGGTGLGLAIVKEIAAAHGGSVSAHSEVGKGSAFTVSLRAVTS